MSLIEHVEHQTRILWPSEGTRILSYRDLRSCFLDDNFSEEGADVMTAVRAAYEAGLGDQKLSETARRRWEARLEYLKRCSFPEYLDDFAGWVSQVLSYVCYQADYEKGVRLENLRKMEDLDPDFPDRACYLRMRGVTESSCDKVEATIRQDTYDIAVLKKELTPSWPSRVGRQVRRVLTAVFSFTLLLGEDFEELFEVLFYVRVW